MTHTSTVLVVENFATFEHKAYNPKTEIESWKFDQDLPKEGFPIRPVGGINRTPIDHGALVLNRLVGNIEIPYSQNHSDTFNLSSDLQEKEGKTEQSQKTIGTAPEGTKIIYSYLTDKVEDINLNITPLSGMIDKINTKEARVNFLNNVYQKAENKEIKLDVISMSDSYGDVGSQELMKIEILDQGLGCLSTPMRYLNNKDTEKEKELKIKEQWEDKDTLEKKHPELLVFSSKSRAKFDEFSKKYRNLKGDIKEKLKDKDLQILLQELHDTLLENVTNLKNNGKLTDKNYKYFNRLLSEGLNALKYDPATGKFPYLEQEKETISKLFERGQLLYDNYTEIKQKFKAKNIPFFSVDMAKDYGIEVHGLNQDGTINMDNEDSRRPKTLSAENTFLFPNEKICSPKSYKTNNEMYNNNSKGGISSLVPSMAGLFAQARSINPTINMKSFIQTLKKSCEDFGNKKFKPASDKNGLYGGYVVDNEVIERFKTKVQENYRAQQELARRMQNSK